MCFFKFKHFSISFFSVVPSRVGKATVRAEGDVGQVGSRQKHGAQREAQARGGDCRKTGNNGLLLKSLFNPPPLIATFYYQTYLFLKSSLIGIEL